MRGVPRSPADLTVLLSNLDRDIREGRGARAREALQALAPGKIPAVHLAAVGALAWRCGIPDLGVKLLHPVVRPAKGTARPPTPAQMAEYAVCLVKIGATEEGLRILERADAAGYPRVHLYRAFAHVSRWDYGGSLPHVRAYLRAPGVKPYEKLVGRMNLAAALVILGDYLKATPLLSELIHDLSVRGHQLLLGRALELAAECFLFQRQWARARSFVEKAEKVLRESEGMDLFISRKVRAFVEFHQDPKSAEGRQALAGFREEAEEKRHWESVRDCDRALALGTGDEALFLKVYFGTPFQAFRDRMLAERKGAIAIPETYGRRLGPPGDEQAVVNLSEGKIAGKKASLEVGSSPHRLLTALAADSHRPLRVAEIFSALCPGEFYNPDSARARVWQAVRRLRQWLAGHKVPLVIDESQGGYRLGALAPCTVLLRRDSAAPDRGRHLLDSLSDGVGGGEFTVQRAAKVLHLSERSARRLLAEAVEKGALQRLGASAATRYLFRR